MCMNKMKRALASIIAALAMVIAFAVPANAASGLCWPSGGPQAARMSVSTWDSSYSNGGVWIVRKTYHIDLNSSGNYTQNQIYFYDGVAKTFTSTNDVYYYHYNNQNAMQIRGRWTVPTGLPGEGNYVYKYCYITI